MTNKSPYLSNAYGLTDVIAAIQIQGSFREASLPWVNWAQKIDKPLRAENWKIVFAEHPEFFRVSDPDVEGNEWVSLRWRHAYDKNFDTEIEKEIPTSQKEVLERELNNDSVLKKRLIRKRLASTEIGPLINTAIELYERSIAYATEKRWMLPLVFGLCGIILGAILQAALK